MVPFTALNVAHPLSQSPAASTTTSPAPAFASAPAPISPRTTITTASVSRSPDTSPKNTTGTLQPFKAEHSPQDAHELNYQTSARSQLPFPSAANHEANQLPPIGQQVPRYEQPHQQSPASSVGRPIFIQPRSPSMRRDTISSMSSQSNSTTQSTGTTNNTSRRTGPLSQVSRDRAALIRKLGACRDCKKRRVACHPGHHNLTWEQLQAKFRRSVSPPAMLELVRPWMAGPTFSNVSGAQSTPQDSHEMDVDAPGAADARAPQPVRTNSVDQHSHRGSFSDTQRKPLPGGRVDRPSPALHMDSVRNDLQAQVSQMLSTNSRTRYSSAEVILTLWEDDGDFAAVSAAVNGLADVLREYYHYTVTVVQIKSMSEDCKSPERWLSRKLHDFVENRDQRDVLKIFLYAGQSVLDSNSEMLLASSSDGVKASVIRWGALQQALEGACSDVLILLDTAYYPSTRVVRNRGVLEIIAASTAHPMSRSASRCLFTRLVAQELQTRGIRCTPLTASELHASILSLPLHEKTVAGPGPGGRAHYNTPIHIMASGNLRFPSIFLAPTYACASLRSSSFGYENHPQLQLSIRLNDENIDVDAWSEWLRLMPEGVKEVRVEAPPRGKIYR